jgi:penicillin-binding protein 1A
VEWIRKQLEDQFGSRLYTQGYKVYTTLDIDMQLAAERNLEQQLEEIEGGKWGKFNHITYEQYQARNANGDGDSLGNSPYLQGAFVALDPRTGAVRALVGGRDFDDSKFNRATQALRQPGSTFKPIVYSTAIHNGYPLSYMLDDSALSLPQDNGTVWTPQNYDLKYEGYMPMRRALYQSRNLPTIRLGMELGERNVIDMARRMGITTPIPPVPSIAIGAADVYPIEMVSAYSTFATLGERVQANGILRIEDNRGNVVWEAKPRQVRVLSRDEAWLMVDVMKDVVRRGTAARVWSSGFHIPAGGKTGTTNDYADVWFIGYTSDMVAGVWLGFDQPQKIMSNAQGGRLAAPAWISFMKEVYQRRPAPPDWPRPEDILVRQIDETTGMLRNPFCPDSVVVTEYFIPGTEPTGECTVHTPFGIRSPMDSAGANTSRPFNQPPRGTRRDSLRPVPDPFRIPGSTPRRPDTSRVRRNP